MPRYETERLLLRDYTENDLHDLHALISDRPTMHYLDDIATNTIDETSENLQHAIANADGHYFCICNKHTGEFIGSVGYTTTDTTPLEKVGHLGFFILPQFHGKGYTPEAAKCAIDFAFSEDGCIRITTGCHKDNIPSQKVIGKLGFRKESESTDRFEYTLNKDDYINIQNGGQHD
ncbi:MAG: GNAT family N-acetyltransferase [Defluviitaleaceae bacterium]|nr:GNAT family N-acetyltransferase [Defluviitaleaceae bacterium]